MTFVLVKSGKGFWISFSTSYVELIYNVLKFIEKSKSKFHLG